MLSDKPYIGLTQENSMEFQVQSVCLIHTRLIVYTTLNLAYSKEHMYYISLICSMMLLFQNLLMIFCVTCDSHM